MESLAQDVFYSVVTKVDDFQLYVFVPDAKHVPVQCRQMVPVEQQHWSTNQKIKKYILPRFLQSCYRDLLVPLLPLHF